MAPRKSKKTEITVSDPPSRGLQILVNGPDVTMGEFRQGHVGFRRQCRGVLGDVVVELCETVKAVRDDIADAEAVVAKAGRAE